MINLFKQEDFSPNLYFRLGLEQDASPRDVRLAYRERAHETHPDKPGNEGKEAEFVAISRAYEVLKDEQKRSMYDRELKLRSTTHEQTTTSRTQTTTQRTATETKTTAKPDFSDASMYDGIKYTEEELNRYKEAVDRFANGTLRSGDLSAVFNFTVGSPIIRKGPSLNIGQKEEPLLLEGEDPDEPDTQSLDMNDDIYLLDI